MTTLSKEEIIKLAAISRLDIHDDEIPGVLRQLGAVLNYAERLQEIKGDAPETSHKNVNVFRADVVQKTDSELILSASSGREENLFVVPSILENS